jgi:ABC-2 type transport system permease protein
MKKSFIAFIRKEALHIVRDPRTLMIAILIPVVQMILFGFAISTEVNDVEVMVSAPCITPAVESKVGQLAHNPYITFKGYLAPSETDRAISANEALAVVVFAADYDTSGDYQVVVDASNPVTAQTASGYLTQILTETDGAMTPGVTILYNPQLRSAYNFVPGIMGLIFMLICAMLTSVSIVREKETGTMEVLLVSPVRPAMIVVAKMIPYFLLAAVDLTIILLISKYALEVPLSGSVAALVVVSLVYIVLALALGLFVSTLVESQMAALLVSGMVFIIPVIMLSGMMFPVENMPVLLQWISNIVPAKWYIPAMRKIIIESLGFGAVVTELSVLVLMTSALILISVRRFKIRLQ